MRRDRWTQLGALAALVVCLAASGLLTTLVAASAGRNRLTYAEQAEKGDPTEVQLGIAMGAFRGLFVNMLWIRANDLKEAGKYYEAVDLAKMITRLQPRFPRVWVFHAWNLAYNISVATNTPRERWQWVQAGIRLLRDEGVPANPTDVLLHKELAWIYLHKVQGIMDDANWLYKRELARDWTIVLGPPPRRTAEMRTTAEMTRAYVEWLSKVNDAKDTLAELYAATPAAESLVGRLKNEAGLDLTGQLWTPQGNGPGEQVLTMIEEIKSLQRIQESLNLAGRRANANPIAVEILLDPSAQGSAQELVRFIRKRMVVDKYHMEPDRMLRYTQEIGPLDWRHAASHALYWSARGVEEAMYRINPKNRGDYDILNTDRLTIQALQELFRNGEVYFDYFNPNFFIQMPNPDFVDAYEKKLNQLVERSVFSPRPGEMVYPDKGRPFSIYAAGYENFLKDAIRFMYRRGDRARAEFYYDKMRMTLRNTNRPLGEYENDLARTLDEFAAQEVAKEDRFTSPYVAQQEVVGSLQAAYLNGLLAGNMSLYRASMDYARSFHAIFVKKQVFNAGPNQGDTARMEVMDRDFNTFAGKVLGALVEFSGIPDGPIMYSRAPSDIQRKTYPMLVQSAIREQLAGAEKAGGSGFDVWFPAPAGMENFRKDFEEREKAKAKDKGTVEQK